MYDNPLTHKFHLQDLERQARPLIAPADHSPRKWSSRPVLGMVVAVAVAGLVGLVASVLVA